MLQIIGFILCALLFCNGALVYVIANRNEDFIKNWARVIFTVCFISTAFFIAWLIGQGEVVMRGLPAQ